MGSIEYFFWYVILLAPTTLLILFIFGAFFGLFNRITGFDIEEYPLLFGIIGAFYSFSVAEMFFDAYKYGNVINFNWYPDLKTEVYKKEGIFHSFAGLALIISFIIFIASLYGIYERLKSGKLRRINEAVAQKKKQEEDIKNAEKQKEEERIEFLKKQEQEEWQKQLDREIERERRLAEVRHESTLKAMQAQIKLYGEYKEKGLDIEKQVFEMRKSLIELEGQENKAMLDDVRQALDDLDT